MTARESESLVMLLRELVPTANTEQLAECGVEFAKHADRGPVERAIRRYFREGDRFLTPLLFQFIRAEETPAKAGPDDRRNAAALEMARRHREDKAARGQADAHWTSVERYLRAEVPADALALAIEEVRKRWEEPTRKLVGNRSVWESRVLMAAVYEQLKPTTQLGKGTR
jgi:hypothetical protein